MNPLFIAIAAASASGAVGLAAAPPATKPHLHYEITQVKVVNRPLTDAERLENACGLAAAVSSHLEDAQRRDAFLRYQLSELLDTTCTKAKPK